MAFWKFDDDTVLRTGAIVEGYSEFADQLRKELFELGYGGGPLVWLIQDKDGAVALDPQNNWLLNLWAHNEALLAGLRVCESDYTPRQTDIPPEAAERLLRFSPRI
jgi:hypothetical protein